MRTLLIDLEEGWLPLKSKIESGQIARYSCRVFDDMEKPFWALVRGEKSIKNGDREVDLTDIGLVIIDSITSAATIAIDDATISPEKVWNSSIWEQRENMIPDKREWGKMSRMMSRAMRYYRNLPIPTIFIFAEDPRAIPKEPDINPALVREVHSFADCMLYLFVSPMAIPGTDVQAGQRVMGFEPNATFLAKARFPDDVKPIRFMTDPTLDKLQDAFGGGIPKKIILYGPPGVGKTKFSGSATKEIKALQLDERGLSTNA